LWAPGATCTMFALILDTFRKSGQAIHNPQFTRNTSSSVNTFLSFHSPFHNINLSTTHIVQSYKGDKQEVLGRKQLEIRGNQRTGLKKLIYRLAQCQCRRWKIIGQNDLGPTRRISNNLKRHVTAPTSLHQSFPEIFCIICLGSLWPSRVLSMVAHSRQPHSSANNGEKLCVRLHSGPFPRALTIRKSPELTL
jgi:hypothetical protein